EGFAKVGSEKRRDADHVGLERGHFAFDRVEGFAEVIVTVKGRKRRAVIDSVVIAQVAQLFRDCRRPTAAAGVIIFDADRDVRQMFLDRGFEIGKADGLQAHIGVVKILNRRLDEKKLHGPVRSKVPNVQAVQPLRSVQSPLRKERLNGLNYWNVLNGFNL